MRKSKLSLLLKTTLLLVAVIGLLSCRDAGVRNALQRAEALMETDPHAARAVLDSIDPPPAPPVREGRLSPLRGNGKGVLALYALLRTQADYKCRVRLTSDSLPLVATNYYGTHRKTLRAALAQYYLGCTYSDMGRDLDAIDAFLRATTLFPDTTNKYFAYSQIELGDLLLVHEKKKEALEAFRHYRYSEACLSDSVNIGYADMYMGRTYLYMENADEAESFFLKVIDNPYMSKEYHANALFQLAKLNAYLKEDYAKAGEYINSYIAGYKQKENIGSAYHIKADILLHENELDSAFYYNKKVLTCKQDPRTFCETYKSLTELSLALNQTDSSDVYFQRFLAFADSVSKIRRDKEISDIENNHVVELHDRELAAQRSRLYWIWGILFVFLVFMASIIILLNDRRRKTEKLKYEEALNAIKQRYITQNIRRESSAFEETSTTSYLSIQEERKAFYQRQYESSDWARYFKKHQSDIKAQAFMPVAEAESFERYLNDLFVDMLLDMVKDNPTLTDQDAKYCAMTLLGFKPAQIAYCFRSSLSSCYTRRSRMKPRMTAEWHQFIFGKEP